MPEEQMEVEIALRDSISSGLRQVGREIDIITRKMKEGGDTGTNSFATIQKGLGKTKEETDKTKSSMSGLSGFLGGMAKGLAGATGLAAGLLAVGDALTGFASKRVHMQMLATDLGLSNEQMSIMHRTLSRMGVDAGVQGQLISSLGQTLKEAFRLGPRSSIVQQLNEMGQTGFAARLLAIVKSGDFNEAMNTIVEQYNKILNLVGPEAAAHFAKIVGWPESVLRQWKDASANVKAGYIASYADSEEYLKKSMEFNERFEDISKLFKATLIDLFLAVDRELKKYDWYVSFTGTGIPIPVPQSPKQMGTFGLEDSGDLPPNKTLNSYVIEGMKEEDKRTNRLLGEIADTLRVFESSVRGSGGGYTSRGGLGSGLDLGGAARGPGGGAPSLSAPMGRPQAMRGGALRLGQFASPAKAMTSSGLSDSQHAPIQTQVPITNSSLSGVRANFAEEMKDPAVRDRLIAYTHAEVGAEGPQAAQAFMETTLNRAASRGKSIRETLSGKYFPNITHSRAARGATDAMREKYGSAIDSVMGGSNISGFATGNASGTVGFAGGPQTSKFGRERFGIEGSDRKWVRQIQMAGGAGGDTPPSDVLAKARNVALTSGPGGVQAFMRAQGYPQNGAWCGQFAASVITSTGGTPPKNPAVASNWRNWGSPTSDPQPGDIAVRKGARTGETGSHVTFVESVDQESGTFKGLGGNQGGRARSSQYPIGGSRGFDFRRADRETIDASLKTRSAQSSKGSVKAEVDFSNMPAAGKKSGDEEGKFKLLKISPAPQGAKDHEGLMTPGDLAHTPYVP